MWDWRRRRRAARERTAARERERAAAHERECAALQDRCESLVGDAIACVAYVEMYDEPEWNLADDYDSVAHAVELALRSGRIVALQWEDPIDSDDGFEFQMKLVEGPSTVSAGTPLRDVGADIAVELVGRPHDSPGAESSGSRSDSGSRARRRSGWTSKVNGGFS